MDGELKAFGLCRGGVIEAIYVEHGSRRQKIATTLVRTLLNGDSAADRRLRASRRSSDEVAL